MSARRLRPRPRSTRRLKSDDAAIAGQLTDTTNGRKARSNQARLDGEGVRQASADRHAFSGIPIKGLYSRNTAPSIRIFSCGGHPLSASKRQGRRQKVRKPPFFLDGQAIRRSRLTFRPRPPIDRMSLTMPWHHRPRPLAIDGAASDVLIRFTATVGL